MITRLYIKCKRNNSKNNNIPKKMIGLNINNMKAPLLWLLRKRTINLNFKIFLVSKIYKNKTKIIILQLNRLT